MSRASNAPRRPSYAALAKTRDTGNPSLHANVQRAELLGGC